MFDTHIRHCTVDVTIHATSAMATVTNVAASDVTAKYCLQVGISPHQCDGLEGAVKDSSRLLCVITAAGTRT